MKSMIILFFCIQNQPEIKYLEEADNEKRY